MKLLVQKSVSKNSINENETLAFVRHNHSIYDAIAATGRIILSVSNGYQCCKPEDILYLKAESNYTEIHYFDGSKKLISKTLKLIEESLPSHTFFRIHKSFVVNVAHISDIILSTQERSVKLVSGHKLPVSRDKRSILLV